MMEETEQFTIAIARSRKRRFPELEKLARAKRINLRKSLAESIEQLIDNWEVDLNHPSQQLNGKEVT